MTINVKAPYEKYRSTIVPMPECQPFGRFVLYQALDGYGGTFFFVGDTAELHPNFVAGNVGFRNVDEAAAWARECERRDPRSALDVQGDRLRAAAEERCKVAPIGRRAA